MTIGHHPRRVPADALLVVALTMADLYDTARDLFVAGMACGASDRRPGSSDSSWHQPPAALQHIRNPTVRDY